MKNKQIKAGDVFATNEGGSVTVIEYRGWDDILIEHNDKHKHRAAVRSSHLHSGGIRNPYMPSVFGVGYIGFGRHLASTKGVHSKARISWNGMMQRCYSAEYQAKKPTYVACSVHPDWHNFQNYADWFYSQKHSEKEGFSLDKDLLVLGNKVYSDETCSFVPQQINSLLIDSGSARGKYPQGVCAHYKKYRALLNVNGKQIILGAYDTPDEAFSVYKKEKESHVNYMARKWREWLHPNVYHNLLNWEL